MSSSVKDYPEAAESTQLVASSARSSTPDVARSLNRQLVLDEDEYTAALSRIIARDFFPSLVHLDATNSYLDALRSDDPTLLNASVRRLQELATPSTAIRSQQTAQTPLQTPWGRETTDTPYNESERPKKRPRYEEDMSLDAFQARYTSEDNSSFTDILEEENRLRKEKWAWAWEAQKRVEGQTNKMIEAREKLLIEPASIGHGIREKLRIEPPTSAGLIAGGEIFESTDGESNMQTALITQSDSNVPDEPVNVMAKKKDTRSAAVDTWKFKVRDLTVVIAFLLTLYRPGML